MGGGTGKLFGLIPDTMRKRCSKDDWLLRLQENGGTPECEKAVVKGLRWFKTNQNPDGSWKAPGFAGHGLAPANAVYRNTLCILMLEVYYRFLNTSGGGSKSRLGI